MAAPQNRSLGGLSLRQGFPFNGPSKCRKRRYDGYWITFHIKDEVGGGNYSHVDASGCSRKTITRDA